jgi:L-threonine kinase
MVNTIEFNKKVLPPQKSIEDLLPILKSGIIEKDIKKIGTAATESIIRNQHRLKYDLLQNIIDISSKNGGLGVIGAHSGDCLGIIFEDEEKMESIKEYTSLKKKYKVYPVKTIDAI